MRAMREDSIVYLDPRDLVLGDNLRTGDSRIDDMVQDLIAAGRQLQPIGIDPARHVLFGFRRAEALRRISEQGLAPEGHPLRRAACTVIEDIEDGDRIQLQIIENSARLNFSPIEEAQILVQLRRFGYKTEAAASMFRRTKGWATQRMALLKLPPDVQAMIPDMVSPWEGYLLSQMDPKTMRRRLAAMMEAAPKPKRHDLGVANRKKLIRQLETCRVNGNVRPVLDAMIQLLRGQMDLDQFLEALGKKLS